MQEIIINFVKLNKYTEAYVAFVMYGIYIR